MPTVVKNVSNRLTAEEIEVRVWAFVIMVLVSILLGAMGMFLYSVTYVTQPMSGMAPIDKIYTSQISTIMVFITGVLGGVAGRSGIKAVATAISKAEANDNDEPPKP
jgi:H+/Cl- antiporter ClcA